MQKILRLAAPIACAALAIWLLGYALAELFGYTLTPRDAGIETALLAALLAAGMIVPAPPGRIGRACAAALPLLCIANAYLMVVAGGRLTIIAALASVLLAFAIFFRSGSARALKIRIGVLSVLPLVLLLMFSSFAYIFDAIEFGAIHVLRTLESPAGAYIAEVIDADAGATGGSTLVEIRRANGAIDLGIAKLSKSPNRVYQGPWGIGDELEVEWRDANTLLVNGEAHAAEK